MKIEFTLTPSFAGSKEHPSPYGFATARLGVFCFEGCRVIKSIQTNYAGCLFRSRLEARWAVFFDAAKIKWEYEPEGFIITGFEDVAEEKWTYLPDFFLPDFKTWVEVKGDIKEIPEDYLYMLQWATDFGGKLPYIEESDGSTSGIVILTNIPQPNGLGICHPILQHRKGGYVNILVFTNESIRVYRNINGYFDASWGDKSCIRKHLLDIDGYEEPCKQDDSIFKAYSKARKARFEHGDTP